MEATCPNFQQTTPPVLEPWLEHWLSSLNKGLKAPNLSPSLFSDLKNKKRNSEYKTFPTNRTHKPVLTVIDSPRATALSIWNSIISYQQVLSAVFGGRERNKTRRDLENSTMLILSLLLFVFIM
jgi:hypothetical protein